MEPFYSKAMKDKVNWIPPGEAVLDPEVVEKWVDKVRVSAHTKPEKFREGSYIRWIVEHGKGDRPEWNPFDKHECQPIWERLPDEKVKATPWPGGQHPDFELSNDKYLGKYKPGQFLHVEGKTLHDFFNQEVRGQHRQDVRERELHERMLQQTFSYICAPVSCPLLLSSTTPPG